MCDEHIRSLIYEALWRNRLKKKRRRRRSCEASFLESSEICRAKLAFPTDNYQAGEELDVVSQVNPVKAHRSLRQSLGHSRLDSTQSWKLEVPFSLCLLESCCTLKSICPKCLWNEVCRGVRSVAVARVLAVYQKASWKWLFIAQNSAQAARLFPPLICSTHVKRIVIIPCPI